MKHSKNQPSPLCFAHGASPEQLKRVATAVAVQCAFIGLALHGRGPDPAPYHASVEEPQIARHTANIAAHAFSSKSQNFPLISAIQTVKASPFQPDGWPATPLFNGLDVALDGDFLTNQANQNSVPGMLRFGPVNVSIHVAKNVVDAAKNTGSDPTLLMAIADKESAFSTKVKAKTSSATGLFQFIDKTWLSAFHSFAERHSQSPALKALAGAGQTVDFSSLKTSKILQMRNDPYLSAALAGEMLKRDRKEIAGQIGRDLTSGETYLIHFLGKDDARRFMQALETNPGAPAAKLLPKPARANRPIFYAARRAKSVHEVHQAFEDMMRMREDRYRGVAEKLPDGVSAYTSGE